MLILPLAIPILIPSLLSHLDRSPFLATLPPPSLVAVDHTLALNCLVLGDDHSHLFPVKIEATESVSALKEEIWRKKTPEFSHVAADKLVLWKVSFADDENLQQLLDNFDPAEGGELRRAATRLNNVFPNQPQDEHLHILVQRPREYPFIVLPSICMLILHLAILAPSYTRLQSPCRLTLTIRPSLLPFHPR